MGWECQMIAFTNAPLALTAITFVQQPQRVSQKRYLKPITKRRNWRGWKVLNFNPNKSYQGLLKQAHALANLVNSQQREMVGLRQKDYSHSERALSALREELDLERKKNAKLSRDLIELKGC